MCDMIQMKCKVNKYRFVCNDPKNNENRWDILLVKIIYK